MLARRSHRLTAGGFALAARNHLVSGWTAAIPACAQPSRALARSFQTSTHLSANPSDFAHSTRIPPSSSAAFTGRGNGNGNGRWTWVYVGGGLTLLLLGGTIWWERSAEKAALDRRSSHPGFPLPLLFAMREARLAQEQGEAEAAALEEKIARQERHHRAKKSGGAQEESVGPRLANPFAQRSKNGSSTADLSSSSSSALNEPATTALRESVPSLLDAERQYRSILSQHLSFPGLDLKAILSVASAATASPQQAATGKDVPAEQKREAKHALEGALKAAPGVDPAVLPYVLGLLAHNLHTQARVLKLLAESNNSNSSDAASNKASSSSSAPATLPSDAPLALAASQRFLQSENAYLQSLTLYRHHFAFSPRPYAADVLQHLGALYFDAGDAQQAEQVWLHALSMLVAAEKALKEWGGVQREKLDTLLRDVQPVPPKDASALVRLEYESSSSLVRSELTDPCTFARFASLSSLLSENLALLHRSRGRFDQAIQWDSEALNQWDQWSSEQAKHKHITPNDVNGKHDGKGKGKGEAHSTGPNIPVIDLALETLPRALHLLSTLTTDLASIASTSDPAKQKEAYATALQAMQVLQRIVQLEQVKTKATTGKQMQQKDNSNTASPPSPPSPAAVDAELDNLAQKLSSPHGPFLSDSFVAELQAMLRAEDDASAEEVAARARAQADSVQKPQVGEGRFARDVSMPTESSSRGARALMLRAEAAAAYSNLSKLLHRAAVLSSQHKDVAAIDPLAHPDSPVDPHAPFYETDAQRAKRIAKLIKHASA